MQVVTKDREKKRKENSVHSELLNKGTRKNQNGIFIVMPWKNLFVLGALKNHIEKMSTIKKLLWNGKVPRFFMDSSMATLV